MTEAVAPTTPHRPRYVVLHHVGHGTPHFDLMLERDGDGPLRTFRVAAWPVVSRQQLTPLADHRRAYLDYEGDVGRGRGSVRRVEAGTFCETPRGIRCGGVDFLLWVETDGTTWIDPHRPASDEPRHDMP